MPFARPQQAWNEPRGIRESVELRGVGFRMCYPECIEFPSTLSRNCGVGQSVARPFEFSRFEVNAGTCCQISNAFKVSVDVASGLLKMVVPDDKMIEVCLNTFWQSQHVPIDAHLGIDAKAILPVGRPSSVLQLFYYLRGQSRPVAERYAIGLHECKDSFERLDPLLLKGYHFNIQMGGYRQFLL